MRCCDCEFRHKCDDTEKVLTAFVKCYRREEFLKKSKKTNADRIRDMSDEELAKQIYKMQKDMCIYFAKVAGFPGKLIFADEATDLLEWLQQPAEED